MKRENIGKFLICTWKVRWCDLSRNSVMLPEKIWIVELFNKKQIIYLQCSFIILNFILVFYVFILLCTKYGMIIKAFEIFIFSAIHFLASEVTENKIPEKIFYNELWGIARGLYYIFFYVSLSKYIYLFKCCLCKICKLFICRRYPLMIF